MPGRGCFGQLVGCVALLVIVAVIFYAFDRYVIAPWAHGAPRLTRTWVGDFRTPSGRHGALELDLRHQISGQRGRDVTRSGRGVITGTAHSCGLVQWPAYDLHGSANRSGSDVVIVIDQPSPAPDGLYWHDLRGSWSGDSLRLSGVLSAYAGTTHTYHGSAVDENQPTRITLHPATTTDYDRACRA